MDEARLAIRGWREVILGVEAEFRSVQGDILSAGEIPSPRERKNQKQRWVTASVLKQHQTHKGLKKKKKKRKRTLIEYDHL